MYTYHSENSKKRNLHPTTAQKQVFVISLYSFCLEVHVFSSKVILGLWGFLIIFFIFLFFCLLCMRIDLQSPLQTTSLGFA